jgi:hypothetical protein
MHRTKENTAMDTDSLIRERAYLLWERAGCPDGCSDAFWLQAVAECATPATAAPDAAAVAEPGTATKKAPVRRRAGAAVASRAKATTSPGASRSPTGMLPS